MERGISVRSVEGTTISTDSFRTNPVCRQKEWRLSMFAENADRFHRSSTSDSSALMSFCHFCAVSYPSTPSLSKKRRRYLPRPRVLRSKSHSLRHHSLGCALSHLFFQNDPSTLQEPFYSVPPASIVPVNSAL